MCLFEEPSYGYGPGWGGGLPWGLTEKGRQEHNYGGGCKHSEMGWLGGERPPNEGGKKRIAKAAISASWWS